MDPSASKSANHHHKVNENKREVLSPFAGGIRYNLCCSSICRKFSLVFSLVVPNTRSNCFSAFTTIQDRLLIYHISRHVFIALTFKCISKVTFLIRFSAVYKINNCHGESPFLCIPVITMIVVQVKLYISHYLSPSRQFILLISTSKLVIFLLLIIISNKHVMIDRRNIKVNKHFPIVRECIFPCHLQHHSTSLEEKKT